MSIVPFCNGYSIAKVDIKTCEMSQSNCEINRVEDDIKIIGSAIKETKDEWLEKAKEEKRLHDSELNEGPIRFRNQWFDKIVACPEKITDVLSIIVALPIVDFGYRYEYDYLRPGFFCPFHSNFQTLFRYIYGFRGIPGYKIFLEEFDCECSTNHCFYCNSHPNGGDFIHHCKEISSWYYNMLGTYLHEVHKQYPT